MNVLITGGSGLVGRYLIAALEKNGHEVRVLSRRKSANPKQFLWDIENGYIDDEAFKDLDAIIHLAGANISKPWSEKYKKELYESRIHSAQLLKKYSEKHKLNLKAFISSSGINYYGTFTSDEILTEDSPVIKKDFLAQLCVEWEAAAEDFSTLAERVICVRTAMVLANDGGAFPLLKKVTDFQLASALGSGKQYMNWIHVEDLANLYVYALENENVNGKINAVADETPNNKDFMKLLAKSSGKIFWPINVPEFILKTILGEMSGIILEGTRASNKKIKSLGFDFKFHTLKAALKNLLN